MFEGVLNMHLLKNKAGVRCAKELSAPLREIEIYVMFVLKCFNGIS